MTKKNKPIIIDGCDVSGCSELYNGCCCDNGSFYCKDQPNCKFKQEKRGYKIEQTTGFIPRENLIETITHLRVLNSELESYNEQLKESQDIEIKENKILREQLEAKEQECEAMEYDYQYQLKNTNKWIAECENLQQQLDQLKANNETWKTLDVAFDNGFIKTQISDMSLAEYSQVKLERDRAEQKLDTIRKYCNYITAFNNTNKTNKGLDVEEVIKIIDEVE